MAALQWTATKAAGSQGASATIYYPFANTQQNPVTTESQAHQTINTAGVWSGAWIRVVSHDRGASSLRSRVNGGNGNQLASITASTPGEYQDTSSSDTLSGGEEINWLVTTGAGGTTFINRAISGLFAATTNYMLKWSCSQSASVTVNGVTRYYSLTGDMGGDTTTNQTEASCQYSIRMSGTVKNLFTNIRTNTKGGNSFARLRKNVANGNLVATIGTGVTGIVEDTSNSDAVVSGDEINFSVDYFADGNALRFWTLAAEFVATIAKAPMIAANSAAAAITQAVGVTSYYTVGGAATSTTESDMQTQANVAQTLTYLSAYGISNTLTGNTTVRVRKNAGNGNGLLTYGTGVTGYLEDSSSSDSFALNDEFTFQIITPGSGTSIVLNNLAVLQSSATAYTLSVSGAITSIGALRQQVGKRYVGAVTPTGALRKAVGKRSVGAIAMTGALYKSARPRLLGSIASSGALHRSNSKVLVGSVASTGAIRKAVGKRLSGLVTASGSLRKAISIHLAGVATSIGVLRRSVGKRFTGIVTPSGVLTAIRSIILLLTGSVALSGTLKRTTHKSLSGTVLSTGSLIRLITFLRQGTIVPTGALRKQITKPFAGAVTLNGTLRKSARLYFIGTMLSSGSLTRSVNLLLGGTITPTSTLRKTIFKFWSGLVVTIGQFIFGPVTAETIYFSGVYEPTVALTGIYEPTISITGIFD